MAAKLVSNDGASWLVLELQSAAEYACENGYQAVFRSSGRHSDGENTFPFAFEVAGLWLCAADLSALRAHIARWLRTPLPALIPGGLIANFQLARLPTQSLYIRLGENPDSASDLHPAVTFMVTAGFLRAENQFLTDPSSLALFIDELAGELASFA